MNYLQDIAYLGLERLEKLDVYLPAESFPRPLPAILLIHGGGWRSGDKAAPREQNMGTQLATHGYAVFSINYLLNEGTPDSTDTQFILKRTAWPQNFHDCKSALRYIRRESNHYGIDPQRLAVMGSSAGGHLAMLVGSTAHRADINQHGLYTGQTNHVSAIINFYGDYDIRGRRQSAFAGETPEETALNDEAASPITYLGTKTPPMFIAHGTNDGTVSVERSRLLTRHLQGLGLDYVYVEIAGAVHSFHLQPPQMNVLPALLSFLEKHLHATSENHDESAL